MQETCFDDEAATSVYSSTPPYAGTYRPLYALSAFDGQNPNGVWTLSVLEHGYDAAGTLYKAGDAAPWGAAIGTQLILTPEPATLALLALGGLALIRRSGHRTVTALRIAALKGRLPQGARAQASPP